MSKQLEIELEIRNSFNSRYRLNAEKDVIRIGSKGACHEFDLYECSKVIGGITTSPWKNRTGSSNTGGQDRASTELLWLALWSGNERRIMVFTDKEMADRLLKRFQGCPFRHQIEIIHYNSSIKEFKTMGIL